MAALADEMSNNQTSERGRVADQSQFWKRFEGSLKIKRLRLTLRAEPRSNKNEPDS